MARVNPNKWFTTSRGQRLDILFSEPPGDAKALLVIFPCTGGTSRAYSVPYEVLADRGFAVVEYHSPICGRSHGHTETRLALRDFYEYLFRRKLIHLPMILFGHSGGANAMLQLKESFLRIQYAFFVNPVLCYRECAAHMYAVGGQPQLIEALKKHTTSLPELTEMLMKEDWLDPQLWHDNELRAYLDSISEGVTGEGLLIGTLLEDLYMPGHSVASELGNFRGQCTVVTSAQDLWCPVSRTAEYAALYGVDHEVLASAPDHFMHGAWPDIWEIFERVTSHVNKGR